PGEPADATYVVLRADVPHGDDRDVRPQGESCRAGLPAVQAPVRRSGPLGIEAQQVPAGQDLQPGVHGCLRGVRIGAIDRILATTREEPPVELPADPGAREV